MELKETLSLSSIRMPISANSSDNSPHKRLDPSVLNLSIKNEPLDIMDCLLNDQDIKDESEDIDVCALMDPKVSADQSDDNVSERIVTNNIVEGTDAENTSSDIPTQYLSNILSGQVPVTRQVVINGRARTCILVNDPQLKQSIMKSVQQVRKAASNPSSPEKRIPYPIKDNQSSLINTPYPMVKCSRCLTEVYIASFREHINSCPPKKTLKITRCHMEMPVPKKEQNQTVRAMYNPNTGEVITLNDHKTKSGFQNPVPSNKKGPKSKIIISKTANNNFQNSSNISSNKTYQSSDLTSSSLPTNNSKFESARTNVQSLQSKIDNDITNPFLTNSDILFKALIGQSSPKSITPSQNTLNSKNMGTAFHSNSINKVSNESSHMKAVFYCNKCDFSSSSRIFLEVHMNKHLDKACQNNASVLTTPKSKYIPDSKNINTVSEINTKNSNSSSTSTPTIKETTIWEDDLQKVSEEALIVSQRKSKTTNTDQIISGNVTNNYLITSIGRSLQVQAENTKLGCENFNDNGPQTSLAITENKQNPTERIKEFKGFDNEIIDDQTKTAGKNLKEALISSFNSLLSRCNNSKLTRVDSQADAQVGNAPISKSACGGKFDESMDEALLSSRRSMRTRSKSFSANKSENSTNSTSLLSPMRTRSKSVCREKFISDQKSRENIQEDENNGEKIGSSKQVNIFTKNSSDDEAKKGFALRGRSKSVVKENCNRQNLLKSVEELKTVSGSNSWDSSVPNYPNLNYIKKLSKISLRNSNNIDKTSGNSNFQSDFENNITSDDNHYSPSSQEDPYNTLLLLKDNTFSCSICSFTTDKKSRLSDHERHHRKTNSPVFQCIYCSQRYTRYMLYLHVQNVHPGQKFQIRDEELNKANTKLIHKCSVCSFTTTDQEKLVLHSKEHPSETAESIDKCSDSLKSFPKTPFICFTCSFEATDQKQLKLHVEKHSFNPVKRVDSFGNQILDCGFCSYSSKKLTDIKKHSNTHKNNRPIIQCPKCDFKSTPIALLYHLQKCRKILKSTSKPHAKSIINEIKSSAKSRKVKPEMPYKCSTCSFSTTKLAKVKIHENICYMLKFVKRPNSDHKYFSCKMCSYRCLRFRDIVRHIKGHKNNSPVIKCSNCSFKSTSSALKWHWRKCKNSKLPVMIEATNRSEFKDDKIDQFVKGTDDSGHIFFDCKMCSYRCPRIKDIVNHINCHKNNSPVIKCSNCSFKSTSRALKGHRRKCKNYKLASMSEAKNRSESKDDQIDQFVTGTDDSGHKFFDCKMCSYRCSRIKDIVNHINCHKNNSPIIKCSNCSFKSTSRALEWHRRKCKNSKSTSMSEATNISESKEDKIDQKSFVAVETKPKSLFKCTKCLFITSLRIKLKLHIRKRHLKPPPQTVIKTSSAAQIFKCSKCSFSCTLRIKLKLHQKACLAAQEKRYKCNYCSFNTSQRSSYQQHKTSHAKNLPFKKLVLKKHMQKYRDSKIYQCILCSFSSSISQAYCNHMKKHKNRPNCDFNSTPSHSCGIKNQQIDSAEKTNSNDVTSSKHDKIIETIRTSNSDSKKSVFQCSQCPYSTFLRIKLNYHTKKHHQQLNTEHFTKLGNLFKCNFCSHTCNHQGTLKMHINTHLKYKLPNKKCINCEYRSTLGALRIHSMNCKKNLIKESTVSSNGKEMRSDTELIPTKQSRSIRATRNGSVVRSTQDISSNKYKTVQKCNKNDSIIAKNNGSKKESNTFKVDQHRTPVADKTNKDIDSNSEIIFCTCCSYTSRRQSDIHRHMKQHRLLPTKQCINCSFKSTPKVLALHLNKCVGLYKESSSKNNREVSDMHSNKPEHKDLEQNYTKTLQVKAAKDTSPKSFKCQYCSFTSFWSYLIDRHMDSHTLLKLPIKQCEKCDFQSTPAALLAHMNACTEISPGNDPEKLKRLNSVANTPKAGSSRDKVNKKRKKVDDFKARDTVQVSKLRNGKGKYKSALKGQDILDASYVGNASGSSEIKYKSLIVKLCKL